MVNAVCFEKGGAIFKAPTLNLKLFFYNPRWKKMKWSTVYNIASFNKLVFFYVLQGETREGKMTFQNWAT